MEPLVFYLSYSRHVRNDPLGSTHQKFYLYKSLRTNNSLNKDKILHQRYLYFKLLILYKWINFIQMLFSGRHLNLLNHQRTAVAEFFTISCHSPLYPTSLTTLAVPMWSVHSLNPASAGWQTLLRTVIPRGLAKVAPEDDTWKVLGEPSLCFGAPCSKDGGELSVVHCCCHVSLVLYGNGPICFCHELYFCFV